MKTTVEIHDVLLERARRRAKETGQPLRALIEDGLRDLLAKPLPATKYKMRDLSYGDPNDPDPLAQYSWDEIRDFVYEDRERRQVRPLDRHRHEHPRLRSPQR